MGETAEREKGQFPSKKYLGEMVKKGYALISLTRERGDKFWMRG